MLRWPCRELPARADHLDRARVELARMREQTLSARGPRRRPRLQRVPRPPRCTAGPHRCVDDPTTTLFFGRIDLSRRASTAQERWYIGAAVTSPTSRGDPVVIDWRAEISTAFYRASAADPDGRACCAAGSASTAGGSPRTRTSTSTDAGRARPAPATSSPTEIERPRVGPDARHRRHDPARAGRDRPRRRGHDDLRAGRTGHRQDRGRPAPRGVAALRVPRAAGPGRRARRRPEPRLPRPHRRGAARAGRGRGRPRDDRGRCSRTVPVRGRRQRPRSPCSRATRGSPRCCAGRCGRTSGRATEALVVPRGARQVAGARVRGAARSSTSCARAASATTPPADAARSGWPTHVLLRMERAGDSPDDRVQDAVARSAVGAPRTPATVWPALDPGTVLFDAARRTPRARRARRRPAHARRAGRLLWTTPPQVQGRRPVVGRRRGPARRGRPTSSSAPRAWATSCSTRRRTSRRCSCGRSGAACSTGSATVLGDIAQGTTPWATDSWDVVAGATSASRTGTSRCWTAGSACRRR